ncbi:S8 family serine peptidase [Nostoc sp. UHCC 0252]|uniref:S8 family serine peptidase n=1 Tax=Nostoc sp. UHCC 0252 TaxID=3110241 RepID=UPI002B209833|nr:S8 family serine peptidase [Nostoc sp. UHCC 0252]MEA5605908.1 S8 family serine peptidase [Nostoc sp. UHCC 0252]
MNFDNPAIGFDPASQLGATDAISRLNALTQYGLEVSPNDPLLLRGSTLYLGESDTTVVTGAGDDQIYTGAGNDNVIAGDGTNTLYLGEGVNVAITGLGDDLIYTGAAEDVIKAGDGNNRVYAGEGLNTIFTGSGNDQIYTGAAGDLIYSGAGNDTIYALEGNNFISAGTGDDTVYVGSGSDRFELAKGEGAVTIFGFGNNDTIRLGTGLTSKALSFQIQNGDTLLKAGDDLLATLKSVQLSKVTIDNSPAASYVSGVFTVGKTGQVSVDYLFDGGGYEGELAIFSLSGLNGEVGSAEFIKESTRRALSNSELGHIVISDHDQGARFQGNLNAEGNLNSGIYDGVKPVFMNPGDKFGIMLVPKGTVQQVFNHDPNSKYVNPLFSLTTVKPQNRYNGQFADITGNGSVFGIEDLPAEGRSDRDYNDIVFQVQGAVGRVISLDELLINGAVQTQQDWRNSDLGQALVEYTKPYASPNMPGIGETLSERVLEILNQAATNKPSKGQISSPGNGANVNQAIADWINTANNRLATLTMNGENAIEGLDNNISDSSGYLARQLSDLQVAISSDGTYMNSWKDYLSKQLSSLQIYTLAQVTNLRNEIIGTSKYLYEWADYSAEEINKTVDFLDKWTTYAQNEIGRITDLLIGQTNYIADKVGVENPDYKNLVKESKAIINDASTTNSNLTSDKNKAVNEAIDVFRAFDNYRFQTIEDASTQYAVLNNEQFSVLTDALSRLAELESNISGVLTDAWNQYQELDRTRQQVIDDASNQASFLNYAWTNLTEDTKAQIDAWSKIAANQKGWHNTTLAERKQNVGLPLIGIIDTGFSADNADIDYSRITSGKDWISRDHNSLLEPSDESASEHGTQILEVIAATRNNGIGIDGINDHSPLWLGRAVGSMDWAQSLIDFVDAAIASKQPNAVINLSFDLTQTNADGSVTTRSELTPLERAALTYAQQKQVLIVTATGNQSGTMSALGQAVKEFDNILTVGAAEGWSRTDYSSYSAVDYAHYGKGVDILAQGVATNDAVGTSVAAAKVTGAVSLLWAANAGLNYSQIVDILKRTATDLNTPGWDAETGVGLLNISSAVNLAKATQAQRYTPPNFDLIQDELRNNGIPKVKWSDFYRFAYYKDLEAKLTGQSWSVVNAVATEREALSLKSVGKGLQQFGDAVGQGVKDVFSRPETQFAGGSPGSGGSNSDDNSFSGFISGGRKFFSERKSELKQVTQNTSSALSNGTTYLKEKKNQFSSEVTTGATNVKNQVKSTTTAINEATRITRNAVSDSTTTITQTSSRIGDNLKQYGDRIGDEARNVGDRVETATKELKQLYDENQQYLILVNPGAVIGVAIAEGLIDGVKEGKVGPVLDTLKQVPVLGTAVGGLEGLYYASQGDWKETLKSSIDSALAFYGGSSVVKPLLVSLFVDISWELKDEDYKSAVAAALSNFNVEPKVADTFVNTAWALKDGNFKDVLDEGLSSAGFSNANQFVDIAWGVKDGNYKTALTVGLQSAGLSNLKIDQSKADAFVNSAFALRDGQVGQVADQLLAIAGGNQQLATSPWVQALRNGNPNDDRAAFSQGLASVGFQNANQWVNIAWDVKDKQYLDALSTGFTLAGFQQGKDWINMAGALQRDDYFSALSTGFKVAGFEKGENLAKAALALRQGDPINAFYEGLSLVDGVSELVDTFKYLKDGNAKKAVPSMITAGTKLAKLFS